MHMNSKIGRGTRAVWAGEEEYLLGATQVPVVLSAAFGYRDMSAYLLLRGMKTLDLRVKRQNESALRIARFLESHPAVERVFYPGLESHAGHAIARQQMRGFGGILSFLLKENSLDAVGRLIPHFRFAHAAGNLGAVETIVAPPVTSSHMECRPEERARLGIPQGLIRYSTGIEDVEDLIEDLAAALETF